jgi:hypothetical protein
LTATAAAAQRVVDGAMAAQRVMQQRPDVSDEESALFKELYELKHPAGAAAAPTLEDGQLEWSLRQAFGGAMPPSGQGPRHDEVCVCDKAPESYFFFRGKTRVCIPRAHISLPVAQSSFPRFKVSYLLSRLGTASNTGAPL